VVKGRDVHAPDRVPEVRGAWWQTAISRNEPNVIEIRGCAIQDSSANAFTELISCTVIGRQLSERERRLLDAATRRRRRPRTLAPSIAAARMATTCG
jgi:citrate synthase